MTADTPGTTWLLAQLKPNHARIADRNLKQQGFQTFLPMEEGTRRQQGRFVTAPRPLFPGYIFVALNTAIGGWRAINSTNGITRLVSFGQEPALVPREIIAQLMQRCDLKGLLRAPRLLHPGDQVRLGTGPFADFIARVENIAPDQRVWVLLDLMGRQTRMAVAPEQLRRA